MHERDVDRKLVREVLDRDGLALKLSCPGMDGMTCSQRYMTKTSRTTTAIWIRMRCYLLSSRAMFGRWAGTG